MGAFWGRRRHSAAGSPHESGPEQLLGGIAELIVHGFLTDSTDPSPVGTPDAANVDPREPETGRGDGRDPTGSRPSSRARTCTTGPVLRTRGWVTNCSATGAPSNVAPVGARGCGRHRNRPRRYPGAPAGLFLLADATPHGRNPGQSPLLRILGTGTRIAGGSSRVKIHSESVSMRAADRPATMATTPSIVTIPCTTARLTSLESKYRRVRSADEPGTMTSRAGTVIEGHDGRHGQYV